MTEKSKPTPPEEVAIRLRSAMNAGFSLSDIVNNCGISQYRTSIIVNNTAQGRVAGGEFNAHEVTAINKHLDSVKKAISDALLEGGWVNAFHVAIARGVKLSSICRATKIPVALMCYRRSRSDNDEQLVNYFNEEEQKRLRSHLQSIRHSI